MSDIFLSYANKDKDRVKPLVDALSGMGWSIFWAGDIQIGENFLKVLNKELKVSRSMLVVWTWISVESDWVLEELTAGLSHKLPIFPVLLDEVIPPLGSTAKQAVDLRAWQGDAAHPEFIKLIHRLRQELDRPGNPPREKAPPKQLVNSLDMTLVLIPAGTFMMGSPDDEDDRDKDEKQHQVTISQPFYLQTTPVTQEQWQQVMGRNRYYRAEEARFPVTEVSYEDAQKFLGKLTRMENTGAYRLPTETEWEYACRAGSIHRFCFDPADERLKSYAWYITNAEGKIHPVGQKIANAWGLHDMHGNVWEWCSDRYGKYPPGPATDPPGPETGEYRVLRGGAWLNFDWFLRSASRKYSKPTTRHNHIGFRVARAV